MSENELYKIFKLRCPACSFEFEDEIECMQLVVIGEKCLDSCRRCGFLGDMEIIDLGNYEKRTI